MKPARGSGVVGVMPTRSLNNSMVEVDGAKLEHALRQHIEQADFPCVGAKSANAQGLLHVHPAWSITSGWDDMRIHDGLLQWSHDYAEESDGLRSYAVVFSGPAELSEDEFEEAMWERLQSLAEKDSWRGQPYDDRVSSDPESALFSLSFGQQGYFVVGMHPNSSRRARRTPYPTLIFNLHAQFEELRERNRYERMRERILDRDVDYSGSLNPMLARHGETSEARQYSGREVGDNWKCPFRDPRNGSNPGAEPPSS